MDTIFDIWLADRRRLARPRTIVRRPIGVDEATTRTTVARRPATVVAPTTQPRVSLDPWW